MPGVMFRRVLLLFEEITGTNDDRELAEEFMRQLAHGVVTLRFLLLHNYQLSAGTCLLQVRQDWNSIIRFA